MTKSNERLTRFLSVCFEIKIYPGSTKKGKEIEFLETKLNDEKNSNEIGFNNFCSDYLKINIDPGKYKEIFFTDRGLNFLNIFLYRNLSTEYFEILEYSKEIVARAIPYGIFERKEYEILILEYFGLTLIYKNKDYEIIEDLIRRANHSFHTRLQDKFDTRWVSIKEGEDLALKISVANNFLPRYYCDQISEISELVFRMDEIFLREGDCFRSFKRIVDSYRTKKSNNKNGFAKINLSIKSENERWLQKLADDNGISRSRVIDVIIENKDLLKIEDFFKQRNISKT